MKTFPKYKEAFSKVLNDLIMKNYLENIDYLNPNVEDLQNY